MLNHVVTCGPGLPRHCYVPSTRRTTALGDQAFAEASPLRHDSLELTADIRRIVTIKPGFLTGPEIAAVLKASFGDDRTRLLQANYSARLRICDVNFCKVGPYPAILR